MRVPGVSVPASRELLRAWQAVLGKLQFELNAQTFEAWFRDSRPLGVQDGRLYVETRDNLALPWLNERLAFIARRVACDVFEQDLMVEFVGHGHTLDEEPDAATERADAAVVDDAPLPYARPRSADAPLIGRVNRRYVLDQYLETRGNRFALDACSSMLNDDELAPPAIAVWGAPGMGKTHLLHAVAQQAHAAGWATACLNAEDFTSRYQAALRHKDTTGLQDGLRNVRLFILDDLQYLVGKPATQDELVFTIDAVCDGGGHVLVAGELHPRELQLPERLNTRLSSGVVARIEPFDTAERRRFVECVVRRSRSALPGWAIERIAAMGDVPARLVQGAVNAALGLQRIDRLDLERLDLELSRLALHEYAPASATADEIIDAVACYFGTTADDVRGRSRKPAIASARAAAAAALAERGNSLAEVATVLGGRHRSTVAPIVDRGRKLLDSDPGLRARIAG